MLEDLIRTEANANRLENNINHVLDQITDVKVTLGSFSCAVIDEDIDGYGAIIDETDIGISKTSNPIPMDINSPASLVPRKPNPFAEDDEF